MIPSSAAVVVARSVLDMFDRPTDRSCAWAASSADCRLLIVAWSVAICVDIRFTFSD